MLDKIISIGSKTRNFVQSLGLGLQLMFLIVTSVPTKARHWYFVIEQIFFIGVLSLIIIIISGAFIGMVVALQGNYTLQEFGAQSELSRLISLSVYRELGPVVSALLFAGRAGSALTAEVGLMRVTEQIASMEVMGVDPVKYILFPRFLAGIISLPLLNILFCATAIYSGFLVSTLWLGIDGGTFLSVMKSGVDFYKDVMQGVIKSIIFSFVTILISLYQGFYTQGGATGLGVATTRTVVYSSLAILGGDFIVTSFLLGS